MEQRLIALRVNTDAITNGSIVSTKVQNAVF